MAKLPLKHPLTFGKKTIDSLTFRDHTTAGDYLAFDQRGGVAQRIALVERARNLVEARAIHCDGVAISTTVSAGIAEFGPERRPESVYSTADRALYQAKAGGRNRVIHEAEEAGFALLETPANDASPLGMMQFAGEQVPAAG